MALSYAFQGWRRLLQTRVVVFSRERSVEDVFRTMRSLIRVCGRVAPCASELLLAEDDPALQAELSRRTDAVRTTGRTYAMQGTMKACNEVNVLQYQ